MIYITEKAKQELSDLLEESVDWPGALLRLMDRGQGKLGLGIDIEKPGDVIVEYEGAKLLVIEPLLATSLNRITLDVDDAAGGAELVISEEVVTETAAEGAGDWVPVPSSSYHRN